jgi:hypothetical protein
VPAPAWALTASFTAGGREIEGRLLLDLDDSAAGIDENVLAVTVHGHFGFIVDLSFFRFLGETLDRGSLTSGHCGLFDCARQVRALDPLFLGKGNRGQWHGCPATANVEMSKGDTPRTGAANISRLAAPDSIQPQIDYMPVV